MFGEYLHNIWTSSLLPINRQAIEEELNIDGGKHVLAWFKRWELFWMTNNIIIEFGFCIIWRIMAIEEGVLGFGG